MRLTRIRLWLRTVFMRARLEREMQEEMTAHLARASERLQARGLSEREARSAARREFGNVDSLQEQARDARGARGLESVLADLRFGLRHFGRTPFSTFTMIMLLALGIGFNAALFTLIYSFMELPPPGIERDESLVRIRGRDHNAGVGRTQGREFSYPEYREYAAQTNLFGAVSAWTSTDVVVAAGGRRETLQSGAATYVTSNYFRVLGLRPILGAGLPVIAPDDGPPQLVGVISHALWDRQFAKAPDVIGRTIEVNDVPVSIVGVAPPRFAGARTGGSQVRVWLPLNARPVVQRTSGAMLGSYDSAVFSLGARLRPGIRASQTTATVTAIALRAAQQSPRGRTNHALSTDVVTLLADNYYPPSGERPSASLVSRGMILLAPLLILLIPCTNVSALLVGLAMRRRREIAVRLALGASRRRIIRQLVTESVLLALSAAILGLFVIWILLQTMGGRVPNIQLALKWPAIVFTFAVAIATGILFGLSPALHATRVSVAEVLKNAANATASTRSRLQSGLVAAQIALTQPLLLGLAVLILGLLADLRTAPTSPFADRILRVSFNTGRRDAATGEREAMVRRLQERFAALPGVQSVVPQNDDDQYFQVVVHPSDRLADRPYHEMWLRTRAAPPGYFDLMGFRVVRGRAFDRTDLTDDRALIIRGDLARQLWGTADPVGRRLVHAGGNVEGTAFVVVGVVDETSAGPSGNGEQHVFVPQVSRTGSFLVRTQGPADPVTPLIRAAANAEAPLLPITSLTTLAALEARERSLTVRLSSAAISGGLIALFLCAIGLYAIVSFAVNQRTREIGIRTAIGADRDQLVRMFFFRGLRVSLVGLLAGLSLSAIVVRVITLLERQDLDARILLVAALVTVVVLAVASLATWIPARRAARVDPLTMLRVE